MNSSSFFKIGVKGRTNVAPKLPEVGHVLGKGRFAVGVAERLRAADPAPDPRSVCVRHTPVDRIEAAAAGSFHMQNVTFWSPRSAGGDF